MSPHAGLVLTQQVVPRLRSAVPQVVSFVGAEDPEELVADSIAMAARLLHNVEKARKKVTPGNIAYYTIQHVKSGRRSVGYSKADVYGSATQMAGRSRLQSLEEIVSADLETGGEIFELHDVLGSDEEDPGTKAARKLDWSTFYAGLPEREKAAVRFLAQGGTLREAARALRVSDSAMQTSKQCLAQKIVEHMGPEILVEVQRRPQWRQDLEATREKLTCRHERQVA